VQTVSAAPEPVAITAINHLHDNDHSALRQTLEGVINNISTQLQDYVHGNDNLLPTPVTHEAKNFIAELTSLYPSNISLPAIASNISAEKFQYPTVSHS
jgi:hypothetical protein